MLQIAALREYLRSSLWFVPLLFAVAAVLLAALLLTVDTNLPSALGAFGGTAEGARSVLSTIAQSMLTFTALVFTVTMLVLQLASSQLSPRVMRTFLRDRGNQVVLGLFVATFVYTLVVLRDIRTPVDGGSGFVPSIAVSASFVLLLGSVLAFIYYIDHMAHAIRATTVMNSIARETYATIDRVFPDPYGSEAAEAPDGGPPASGPPAMTIGAPRRGVLVGIDDAALLEIAGKDDRAVVVVPMIGDALTEGSPLFRIWGGWDARDIDLSTGTITLARERTMQRDAAFGIRQLVDIALRALSPGINDPTTAVQALDQIDGILQRLAVRRFPSPVQRDDKGVPRVWMAWPSWTAFVQLATEEIGLAGTSQPAVTRRLRTMLEDVAAIAPPERRQVTWAAMPEGAMWR
jgi:uncharacterized membrane protein